MNPIPLTGPSSLERRLAIGWIAEVRKKLRGRKGRIELDLSETRNIDASGVAALLELNRWHRDSGVRLRIFNASAEILQILEIMGVHREFEFASRLSDDSSSRRAPLLIVEDELIIQSVTSMVLKPLGHPIVMADNGIDALSLATREKPGLIVLDYMLPFMDGEEVLRRLKLSEDTSDIPVIVMTANSIVALGDTSRFPEASAVFSKPFQAREFRREAARLIYECSNSIQEEVSA